MSRALYTLTQWWLNQLPVDPVGRRVFDETLADWRKELVLEQGGFARVVIALRGVAAVLRGVVRVAFRETGQLAGSGLLTRFAFWLVMPQLLSFAVFMNRSSDIGFGLVALGLVISTAFYAPAALFLACVVTRRPRVPALGASCAAVCLAVPLLVWAVPNANAAFVRGYSSWAIMSMEGTTRKAPSVLAQAWPQVPLAFYNDWPSSRQELVPTSLFPIGWKGLQWTSFFGGYLALCLTLPWLAVRLRQRGGALSLAVGAIVLWLMLYQPTWNRLINGEWLFLWLFFGLGVPWVPVVVVVFAGLGFREAGGVQRMRAR